MGGVGTRFEVGDPWERCPQTSLCACSCKGLTREEGGLLPARPTLPVASPQIGARVASLRSLSSAGAKGVFPVSVSLGVYRGETGNGVLS